MGRMAKPSLFVGSSSEGLEFARAARAELEVDAEVTLWNDGFFELGSTFIETLVNALPRFDFAVLVLTPDDWVSSRDVAAFGPRDNVIFELGLFMGHLGRSRTFMLHQRATTPKIPTDLSGVTTATYDWPRQDQSYRGAVGTACDSIRHAILALGLSETKTAHAIGALTQRQERQQEELSTQKAQIRSLRVALQGIVTQYELDKLLGLEQPAPFLCYYSEDMYAELKRLRAMGLIQNHDNTGLSTLRRDYKDKNRQFDLHRFFFLTKDGIEYLTLRRELQGEES